MPYFEESAPNGIIIKTTGRVLGERRRERGGRGGKGREVEKGEMGVGRYLAGVSPPGTARTRTVPGCEVGKEGAAWMPDVEGEGPLLHHLRGERGGREEQRASQVR